MISDFSFCLVARDSVRPSSSGLWCPLFRFFPPVIGAGSFFPMRRISSWVSWMKAADYWVGWRGARNTEGERGCISWHAYVGSVTLHQYPGMPPLSPAQPSTEHPGCIQGDQDQTLPDVWYKLHTSYLGFSFPSRILFAAIILLRLVCDDWPASHSWCEANG